MIVRTPIRIPIDGPRNYRLLLIIDIDIDIDSIHL